MPGFSVRNLDSEKFSTRVPSGHEARLKVARCGARPCAKSTTGRELRHAWDRATESATRMVPKDLDVQRLAPDVVRNPKQCSQNES